MNREHDEVTYSLLGNSTLLNSGWSTRYCIITVCSSTLLNTGWSTRYCIITVSGFLFYFGSSWQINLTMIVVDIKEFRSAAIWCRVKWTNSTGGEFWNVWYYRWITTQVNTELYCTALRLDLRLHYILDLGCKSSMYSCTLNTDVKTNLPKTLCHDSLIHGWTVTQVILVSLSFPDLLYTPPVFDHMRDSSNIWHCSWWCHWTELYPVLFHSAPLCDLVLGPPFLWGRKNTAGPETVHNRTLTVMHQEVAPGL